MYELVLIAAANVTIQRCSPMNPASLLPNADDGEPHNCEEVMSSVCFVRPGLERHSVLKF